MDKNIKSNIKNIFSYFKKLPNQTLFRCEANEDVPDKMNSFGRWSVNFGKKY